VLNAYKILICKGLRPVGMKNQRPFNALLTPDSFGEYKL